MHVLREGGEYLGRRERQLWWYFVGGSVAMILFSLALALRQLLAVVAIPVAFVLANAAVSRLARVRRGRVGERLVSDLLKRLPNDYYLVNDVIVKGGGGNIDHVVVGPFGVVVIETKRLVGMIRCDGDDWYVNGRRRGSISRQVNRGAVVLRRFLAERHPNINSGYIQSIAVFTHPLCRLKVDRARTTVVRYSELMQLMLELGQRHRMPTALARSLAESLAGSQAS